MTTLAELEMAPVKEAVAAAISGNPALVEAKDAHALLGVVMRALRGHANPAQVMWLLQERLGLLP